MLQVPNKALRLDTPVGSLSGVSSSSASSSASDERAAVSPKSSSSSPRPSFMKSRKTAIWQTPHTLETPETPETPETVYPPNFGG